MRNSTWRIPMKSLKERMKQREVMLKTEDIPTTELERVGAEEGEFRGGVKGGIHEGRG